MSNQPIICTFHELARATYPLHLNDKGMVASLHDVWLKGAPTPRSIVRNPKEFDERRVMAWHSANFVERIVLPSLLAAWIKDVAQQRGIDISGLEALNVADGRVDYEIPIPFQVNKK